MRVFDKFRVLSFEKEIIKKSVEGKSIRVLYYN